MTTIKATGGRRRNFYKLLDEAARIPRTDPDHREEDERRLDSEDDWRSIQETLYLLSIGGMRESIRKGLKTPVEKCSEKPGW